eukprot:5145243-Alexandrium_andersonii.AAC.1
MLGHKALALLARPFDRHDPLRRWRRHVVCLGPVPRSDLPHGLDSAPERISAHQAIAPTQHAVRANLIREVDLHGLQSSGRTLPPVLVELNHGHTFALLRSEAREP